MKNKCRSILLAMVAGMVVMGCAIIEPAKSSNANLSSLSVSAGVLSPAFTSETTAYSVSVPYAVTSITLMGTQTDQFATVSANSGEAQALNVGVNTITLTVTSPDGTTVKNYVVTVTRTENADLSALSVSEGTLNPVFDSGTTEYTVSVANEVATLTATGTIADSTATISANNGVAQALNVGANTITLAVTAKDGITVKNYVITATRTENADLSALSVNTGALSPAFVSGTTAYSISVANDVATLTVTGTQVDNAATISANNGVAQALNVGANTITLAVTAKDGTTVKNYGVTVYRASFTSPNIGNLMSITGGSFQFDSTATNTSSVSAFQMSEREITRGQFLAVMGTDPSNTTNSSGTSDPVQQVSWYDSLVFCNKLSILEGKTPVYTISGSTDPNSWGAVPTAINTTWDSVTQNLSANGYRLPTEAEWEYAYRAGTTTTYHWGTASDDTTVSQYAWSIGNALNTTHPGGNKLPNAFGLYDMSGNVWEWCWDWIGVYPSGAQTDPTGAATGAYRIIRGGGWSSPVNNLSATIRNYIYPNDKFNIIGFRVVYRTSIL